MREKWTGFEVYMNLKTYWQLGPTKHLLRMEIPLSFSILIAEAGLWGVCVCVCLLPHMQGPVTHWATQAVTAAFSVTEHVSHWLMPHI